MFHESWSCFTHPPLEPPADRSRRRGEPITLNLQGVAVADGDNGGPVLVAADAIRKRIDTKTRDAQVCVVGGGGVLVDFTSQWEGQIL